MQYDLTRREAVAYLEDVAAKHEINIKNGKYMDEYDTAFYVPMFKLVVMNPNYESTFSPAYQMAHELGHGIGWTANTGKVYHFSPLANNEEEKHAHRVAIELLSDFFFPDGIDESSNYSNFMAAFGIAGYLEHVVLDVLRSKMI